MSAFPAMVPNKETKHTETDETTIIKEEAMKTSLEALAQMFGKKDAEIATLKNVYSSSFSGAQLFGKKIDLSSLPEVARFGLVGPPQEKKNEEPTDKDAEITAPEKQLAEKYIELKESESEPSLSRSTSAKPDVLSAVLANNDLVSKIGEGCRDRVMCIYSIVPSVVDIFSAHQLVGENSYEAVLDNEALHRICFSTLRLCSAPTSDVAPSVGGEAPTDGDGVFQLFVRGVGGTHTIDGVRPDDTAGALHALLEAKTGVSSGASWLAFAGKRLDTGRTLASYGLRGGSTVHLAVRGRGGGCSASKGVPKSKWDENGCSSLKKAFEDTVMIDAGWLADLADQGGIVPRCQDVPDEAKVSLAEMEAWTKDQYTVGALIMSYPWLDKNHPDPFGELLKQLAPIFKIFANEALKYPGCRVGVFWDYCSLPQRKIDGVDDRSEKLLARFKRALGGINAWYGHQKTNVLLVKTPLPTGHEYTNTRHYDGRGWCFAENQMSAIVKDELALIDTSQLKGDEQTVDDLRKNGKANRPAPIAPDVFKKMLESGVEKGTIKFTNKGDVDLVAGIYERAFLDEMTAATALYYPSLEWGDTEIMTLSAALAFAHAKGGLANLGKLNLSYNKIGDAGVIALADAVKPTAEGGSGALANLTVLDLYQNQIGDDGMKAFSGACAMGALAKIEKLFLNNNQIGDDGMKAFSDACAKGGLANLGTLWLYDNKIGDDGMKAISDACAKGALANLTDLRLFNNPASEEAQQKAMDAIENRGQ